MHKTLATILVYLLKLLSLMFLLPSHLTTKKISSYQMIPRAWRKLHPTTIFFTNALAFRQGPLLEKPVIIKFGI